MAHIYCMLGHLKQIDLQKPKPFGKSFETLLYLNFLNNLFAPLS